MSSSGTSGALASFLSFFSCVGTDAVARRLPDGRVDGVEATWSHEDAIAATVSGRRGRTFFSFFFLSGFWAWAAFWRASIAAL